MGLFGSGSDDPPALDVTIQTIGQPPDEAVHQVEDAVETQFHVVARLDSEIGEDELPDMFPAGEELKGHPVIDDPDWERYDAEKLIELGYLADGEKTITVADVPAYYDQKTKLFGFSFLDGDVGLVTTTEFYEDDEWTDRSSRWIRKEAIMILGQLFGRGWCDTDGCVMQQTETRSQLTELDESICKDCGDVIPDEFLR